MRILFFIIGIAFLFYTSWDAIQYMDRGEWNGPEIPVEAIYAFCVFGGLVFGNALYEAWKHFVGKKQG